MGCAPGAAVGAVIDVAIVTAVAITAYVAVDHIMNSEESAPASPDAKPTDPASNAPKPSDRPPGPDGKTGSTGGPGEGKRFPAESPDTKAGKEGVPCAYFGKPTTNEPGRGNSREQDHIDPKSREGNNSPENERDACRDCNRSNGPAKPR